MWTVPNSSLPPSGLRSTDLAPIIRLGKSELLLVTRFLSFREIASLYMSGNGDLVSKLSKLDLEVSFLQTGLEFSAVLNLDPFPLLSRFSSLQSLRLQCLWWTPSSTLNRSPLFLLPSTLRHLELRWAPFPHEREYCVQGEEKTIGQTMVEGMSFNTAFPELQTLIITTPFQDMWQQRSRNKLQHWTNTLPTSLTHLTLSHMLAVYMSNAIVQEFSSPSTDASSSISTDCCTLKSASLASKLPHLMHLELLDPGVAQLPSEVCWPTKLTTLIWPPLTGNPPGSDPTIMIPLDSWQHPEGTLPSTLTSIKLRHATIDCINSDDTLIHRIASSGMRLTELQFGVLRLPNIPSSELRATFASAFTSLTSLDYIAKHGSWWILPPTLRYLRVGIPIGVAVRPKPEDWSLLPQGLLQFHYGQLSIELGHIPLLPRTITDLTILPINRERLGTQFLTQAIRDDGLPYDEITPDMNLLYGLPPNLRTLHIYGSQHLMHAKFGLYLPRSLMFVTGNVEIDVLEKERSKLQRFGSIFGVGDLESTDQLLKRCVDYFPPGCQCSFNFRIPTLTSSSLAKLKDITRLCCVVTAAHVVGTVKGTNKEKSM